MSALSDTRLEPWAALRHTWFADRLVRLTYASFAVVAVLYLPSLLSEPHSAYISRAIGPAVFLSLTVLALVQGIDRLRLAERAFWLDVSAAFGSWLIVAVLYLFSPHVERPLSLQLLVEVLYAGYYVFLILAVERQPDRRHGWRDPHLERLLTWPAVTVFILGLLGYFVLLPIVFGNESEAAWTSSFALYLTLDAYLVARFCVLMSTAHSPRWRTIYLVMAITAGAVLSSDLLEVLLYNQRPEAWGSLLDLVYYTPFLAIVMIRVRHCRFVEPEPSKPNEPPQVALASPSGKTLINALAFPVLHYGGYTLGLLGAADKQAREGLVFVLVLVLGLMAIVQQVLLERKARQLWDDREALRNSEKDLRLMVERYHTDQKLRLSEEKFAKAMRASPDIIAVSSLVDGQITDVNDSFEQFTGHRREDVVGRSVGELDLWSDPEDRRLLVQQLEREGSVRGLRASFRAKDGRERVGILSAEKIMIEGEPYLVSVTHVPAGRLREPDHEESADSEAVSSPPPAGSPETTTS